MRFRTLRSRFLPTLALALLERARATVDPEALDRIWVELGKIFRQEIPVTYLYPRVTYYAAHRRVKGLESPFRANPLWGTENLWIEDEP